MLIADAHADTLFSLTGEHKQLAQCTVQPDRLRAGHVALQVYALYAGAEGTKGTPYENGLRMLDALPRLGVPILTGELPDALPEEPAGVISIEGGEMLEGRLDRLHEFYRKARIRLITLTWNHENQIGFPSASGSREKLKPFGRELIREMDRLGILVDVSHLNEAGFYDAAERSHLPIIASHSNDKRVCDVARNLTRDQIRLIIEKQGFIGINFYSPFVKKDGEPDMDDVIRHIDAIAELGGVDVLGFGSDFDGIEVWPKGLAGPEDFPALIERLSRRGYTNAQLEGIAGLNLWRVLKRAEQGL